MAIQNIKAPFFLYSDYLRDLCCQQYNQLLSFHVITRQFILSLLSVISQLFIIVFHILVANEQLQTNRYDDIAKCNERHGANFLGSNQLFFYDCHIRCNHKIPSSAPQCQQHIYYVDKLFVFGCLCLLIFLLICWRKITEQTSHEN